MSDLYALFLCYGDDYTYNSEVVYGIFESEELAEEAFLTLYDKIKRFNHLRNKNKITNQEAKELEELYTLPYIHTDDYFIKKFTLNKLDI